MLHRIIIAIVSLFWLAMVGLYVRLQVFPETMPAWLVVPVPHVMELVLRSADSSTLAIYQSGKRIGTLYVRGSMPKPSDPLRQLLLNGELSLPLPGASEKLTFRSRLDFVPEAQTIHALDLTLRMRQQAMEFHLTYDGTGSISYALTGGDGRPVHTATGSLEELLAATPLGKSGISMERVRALARDASPPVAHRDTIKLAGESIPVYRLTLPLGESLSSQIDISQLGRILRITTPFGMTLLAEGIEP